MAPARAVRLRSGTPRVGGRAVMQLSVKQSPCASVVRSHPGPHQSSWRSWIARLPPKEQVAGSSPAGDAWSRDRVVRYQSAKLRHAGSIPAEASVTFPAVEVRTRACCERGSTAAGYRLNRFESLCQSASSRWANSGGHPHIRARHAQPPIQGGCGSTHAGYRLLSGRSRVRIPSRRPAPRSSAAEHQHRCAPPHPHPPARSAPRRNHQ